MLIPTEISRMNYVCNDFIAISMIISNYRNSLDNRILNSVTIINYTVHIPVFPSKTPKNAQSNASDQDDMHSNIMP